MNKKKTIDYFGETPIYYASRGDDFKAFVHNILIRGKVKSKFLDPLLTEEAFRMYSNALTSTSADPINNYEVYEQIGDVLGNKIIVCYMYKRFPHLKRAEGVKVVARLKINYAGCQSFKRFADKLGFWPFISASEGFRGKFRDKLLEDCFEAFLGVTEEILDNAFMIGVGYNVVYDIVSSIFDEDDISLRHVDLFDAKTRLKEIFDVPEFKSVLGPNPIYNDRLEIGDKKYIRIFGFVLPHVKNSGYEIARVEMHGGPKKSEQVAAEMAIQYLKNLGYIKMVPVDYYTL